MGTMKKLLALVLALAMVMMAGAAFATSLTIKNATLGQEYKAYKIFDADIVVSCDSHWSSNSSERPLYIGLIHIGTNQEADSRVIIRSFQ